MVAYKAFYEDVSVVLEEKYNMYSDHQRYHKANTQNLFVRKFEKGKGCENNIILRIAWSACLWDSRRIAIARTIADCINRHFEYEASKEYSPDLIVKKSGY
jgi:voltage-gated potassium channel